MGDLGRLARRAAGEVALLEQTDLEAAQGRVARDPGAVDATTDNYDVEGATIESIEYSFACQIRHTSD